MDDFQYEREFKTLFNIVIGILDAYPREPNDVPSEEIVAVLMDAGFRLPRTVDDALIEEAALAIEAYEDAQPSGTFDVHEDNRGKALAVLDVAFKESE